MTKATAHGAGTCPASHNETYRAVVEPRMTHADDPIPILTGPPMDGDWAGPNCGGYGCPSFTPMPVVVDAPTRTSPNHDGGTAIDVGLVLIIFGIAIVAVLAARSIISRRRP